MDCISLTTDGGATYKKVSDAGAGGHSAGGIYRAKGGSYYVGTSNRRPSQRARAPMDRVGPSRPEAARWLKASPATAPASSQRPEAAYSPRLKRTALDGPAVPSSPHHGDGCFTGYDQDHHVLYASCMADSGFWRVVTQ